MGENIALHHRVVVTGCGVSITNIPQRKAFDIYAHGIQ